MSQAQWAENLPYIPLFISRIIRGRDMNIPSHRLYKKYSHFFCLHTPLLPPQAILFRLMWASDNQQCKYQRVILLQPGGSRPVNDTP